MKVVICHHGNWLFACVSALLFSMAACGDFRLGMSKESSCTKTHYYKAGDIFIASTSGFIHAGHCPLTFIHSGTLGEGSSYTEPCLTLCVRIIGYTMESCKVKMEYHDGLNDFTPVKFDCHNFPPVMWCSSKNDLKVTVSEMKDYDGKDYAISLEIKPFCGTLEHLSTDSSIVSMARTKPSTLSQTAVIIGAVVGTISILFVMCWVIYCIKQRNVDPSSSHSSSSSSSRPDRNVRGSTPNQPTNRYAPVDRIPASSQSSTDRGVGAQCHPDLDRNQPSIANMMDRRLHSPFQPPQTNRNQYQTPGQGQYQTPGQSQGQDQIQQQVLYSDIDRGPQPGDKWFPITALGPTHPEMYPPSGFASSTNPSNQMSQYMMQNQVYNYPMDGEMHTAPTDTRYVVYDFDYEGSKPTERKYSAGKCLNAPYGQSPVKDMEKSRPREITPLRETVRVMPPVDVRKGAPAVDSTTTDHTSDNDSSISGTTEDETTDDQIQPGRYNFVPTYGFNNPPMRPNHSDTRLYDPRNFQRIDSSRTGNQSDISRPGAQDDVSKRNDSQMFSSPSEVSSQQRFEEQTKSNDGPVPQVPPMPKEFQRPQITTPVKDLPWPHGPPPPYSQENKFVV